MSPIFIQAIGFVGVLFFIISYQIKSNKILFLMQMLGTAMFCCQFLLLGATSGAANLIGIIVRNALLMKCRDWPWIRSKWTELIFLAFFTIAFIATWQGPISLCRRSGNDDRLLDRQRPKDPPRKPHLRISLLAHL